MPTEKGTLNDHRIGAKDAGSCGHICSLTLATPRDELWNESVLSALLVSDSGLARLGHGFGSFALTLKYAEDEPSTFVMTKIA